MSTRLAAVLLVTALASCGAAKDANQMDDSATVAHFAMSSQDISEGQPIPPRFTCDGGDQSPALSWERPPAGTKSLAVIVDDPDAPGGTFMHWGAYDIPATTRSIARGKVVGKQGVNGFGKSGYGGPCPPRRHGPHRYRFKLYALDVAALEVAEGAKAERVEAEARKHQLGLAQLTGTYERK